MCENCYGCDSSIEHRKTTVGCHTFPKKVNGGVYICSYSVRSDEYICKTKMHLFMTVTSNLCINQNVTGFSFIT